MTPPSPTYDLTCAHPRRKKVGTTEWTDLNGVVYRHHLCRECFYAEVQADADRAAEGDERRWELDGWTLRAVAKDAEKEGTR